MHQSKLKKLVKLTISIGALATITACTTTVEQPYVADWKPTAPQIATLLDSGKTIRAADGSFTLVGGGDPVKISEYTTKVLLETPGLDLDDFKKIASGRPTYKVRVKVPGQTEELYGIMAFFSVGDTADSSTLRAWRIEIPEKTITEALGGGLGHTTGEYVFKGSLPNDTSEKLRNAHSYVLWLSDYPLIIN